MTIYLLKPKTWSTVNFYAWSDTFEAAELLGNWPGKNMATSTVVESGKAWYKWTAPKECDIVNIIFNNETDQTVDITNIEGTHYFILNEPEEGKAITVTDVTDIYGGVTDVAAENVTVRYNGSAFVVEGAEDVVSINVYNMSGSEVAASYRNNSVDVQGLQNGFYLYRVILSNGKVAQGKIVKR